MITITRDQIVASALRVAAERYGQGSAEHRFIHGYFHGHSVKLWLTTPQKPF